MSRIYFHSPHGQSEVRGSERAYAAWLCRQFLHISLDISGDSSWDTDHVKSVLSLLPPSHYAHGMKLDYPTARLALSGFSEFDITIGNVKTNVFDLSLNTAWKMGNEPIQLMARLHGQCELHCYVEGKNRAWLAGIIKRGQAADVMRSGGRWDETVALLETRDDEPVVTSYSVCDQFPNKRAANVDMGDEWYDLPYEMQWQMAMEGLCKGSMGHGLDMNPDKWDTFYFGSGLTGFDVINYLNQKESGETKGEKEE